MKFREFLNEGDVKTRKNGGFDIKTLQDLANEKSPDYAGIKLGLFMLGKSITFKTSYELRKQLTDVFTGFLGAYSSKNLEKLKYIMNESSINSDLDVVRLMDSEESAELAGIYTALFMVGKGLDFEFDEDIKALVKHSLEGCADAIARSKKHGNS